MSNILQLKCKDNQISLLRTDHLQSDNKIFKEAKSSQHSDIKLRWGHETQLSCKQYTDQAHMDEKMCKYTQMHYWDSGISHI